MTPRARIAAGLVIAAGIAIAIALAMSGGGAIDGEDTARLGAARPDATASTGAPGDTDADAGSHASGRGSGGAEAGAGASTPGGAGTGAGAGAGASTATGAGAATPSPGETEATTTSSPASRSGGRFPDGGLAPGTGALAAERIRSVVRDAIPELRFCFEWQLSRHPDLGGRVTLEFRIAEDGTVEDAAIAEEDLGDETVLRCFRGVTSRMRFPAPEGGSVTVRYPITLSAGDEPPQPPPAERPH